MVFRLLVKQSGNKSDRRKIAPVVILLARLAHAAMQPGVYLARSSSAMREQQPLRTTRSLYTVTHPSSK
jgi:hypothetical protein